MTNQQGAPEALTDPSPDQLRAIARTARNSSGSASDDCGPLAYVLHGWRTAAIAFRAHQAALVEAQQPADCGNTPYDEGPFTLAQQPAPSAAAAVGQEPNFKLLRKALADRRFRGETDLQDLVNMAANIIAEDGAILRARQTIIEQLKTAAKPSPTPQADSQPAPIDMVLHCPKCGVQHIDEPEEERNEDICEGPDVVDTVIVGWDNPPHRSHLCHGCGHIWRPADVPTNGVAAVKTTGKADSPIAASAPADSVTAPAGGEINRLRAQVESLTRDCGRQASKIAELIANLEDREARHRVDRARLQTIQEHRLRECWYWQGDGQDHLKSLCNTLPVVIRADQLRAIVSTPPAQAADSVLEDAALVFTAAHIDYVARYGGRCRDCADESGVCPGSGLPCADSRKAIKHVFDALEYGVKHGYIKSPVAARKQGGAA